MSNVQADWDNRHFIANIQYNIMKVVTTLNDFGPHQRSYTLTDTHIRVVSSRSPTPPLACRLLLLTADSLLRSG